jgi:hypothetical protein
LESRLGVTDQHNESNDFALKLCRTFLFAGSLALTVHSSAIQKTGLRAQIFGLVSWPLADQTWRMPNTRISTELRLARIAVVTAMVLFIGVWVLVIRS